MSPSVPGDDHEQLKSFVDSNTMRPVDPDEVVAKTPERVQLEGGLNVLGYDVSHDRYLGIYIFQMY